MKGRCLRLFTHTRKAHTHIRHFPEKHGIPMLRRLALQGRHEALRFKAKLAIAFDAIDENGDGKLSAEELLHALQRLEASLAGHRGGAGEAATEQCAMRILEECDLDGDGVLSFDEFVTAVALHLEVADLCNGTARFQSYVGAAFKALDEDGNGRLDAGEIAGAIRMLGLADGDEADVQAEAMLARMREGPQEEVDLRAFAHAVATDVNIGTLAAKLTEEAVWASASKI